MSSLILEEIDHFETIVGPLFRRKFGTDGPPDNWPHHLCAFAQVAPGQLALLGYVHFGTFGDTCLVGGMCTNGDALRQLPDALRDEFKAAGGVAVQMLRFGFQRFANQFAGFFGIVGDPRALEVDLAAGFELTEHHQLVRFLPRPLPPDHVRALTAKVLALGSF